ncbi:hypothetical protein NQ176_g5955 [Zarea fungicola]|uniref:Uncharacterized protein n=1 Tax=Zarea fungicola TaxID=93591 RepID=A0ACC1N6T9_9HYPO|nr:hypothetical protein NQ176_g5955 [Lecanicillium fungicola]
MKLLVLLPPLAATLAAVDAKLLSSQDIDASCGSSSISTNTAAGVLVSAKETEAMMTLGVQALTQSFGTLSLQEQIFQQLIMGSGSILAANRAAAASTLQATLSFAQTRAQSANGRQLLIQCNENSRSGIASVSDRDPDGKPLPTRYLYNMIHKRKVAKIPPTVAPLFPTACTQNSRAYVDGSVIVLCAGWWNTYTTRLSSRKIAGTDTLSGVERSGKLIVGDNINRIQDLASFNLLHELMHWGTYDGVSSYRVGDGNGYKWVDVAKGFLNTPTQTAQIYPFICFGGAPSGDGD